MFRRLKVGMAESLMDKWKLVGNAEIEKSTIRGGRNANAKNIGNSRDRFTGEGQGGRVVTKDDVGLGNSNVERLGDLG